MLVNSQMIFGWPQSHTTKTRYWNNLDTYKPQQQSHIVYTEMKGNHSRIRGETAVVVLTSCPRRAAFSADLLDQKSKSPLFPLDWGSWLQLAGG